MKRYLSIFFFILVVFMMILIYVSRNPLIVDDITPVSSCHTLIEKSDVLYVIPNFEGHSLDKYPKWCKEMKALNKTFGLHGITHEYHEFDKKIDHAKLEEAIKIFEDCFGYKPAFFRPPYNKISVENKALLKSFNMTLYQGTYLLHPYCHCQPGGWMKILDLIIGC